MTALHPNYNPDELVVHYDELGNNGEPYMMPSNGAPLLEYTSHGWILYAWEGQWGGGVEIEATEIGPRSMDPDLAVSRAREELWGHESYWKQLQTEYERERAEDAAKDEAEREAEWQRERAEDAAENEWPEDELSERGVRP